MELVASSPTKERLLSMVREFFYSPNVVLNDDGTLSNLKGVISGYTWNLKKNRYRLELLK
jgi:hypothetical protein